MSNRLAKILWNFRAFCLLAPNSDKSSLYTAAKKECSELTGEPFQAQGSWGRTNLPEGVVIKIIGN